MSQATRRLVTLLQLLVLSATVIGGIWATASAWHTRSLQQPVRGWTTTTGHVVAVREETFRSTTYSPVIAFIDTAGRQHQFAASYSGFQAHVGDTAQVNYNPGNPQRAHDLSNDEISWRAPFVTGIWILCLGAIGWTVVLVVVIHRYRVRARQDSNLQPLDP